MEAVVDPLLLAPPDPVDLKGWVTQLDWLTQLAASGQIVGSCAKELRDSALALWYSDEELGPSNHELVRIASELSGRLEDCVGNVLLDNLTVKPSYRTLRLSEADERRFEEYVAEAAYECERGRPNVGVFGPSMNWEEVSESLLAEAEILMEREPGREWDEPSEGEGTLRAFIPRCSTMKDLFVNCCKYPCALIHALELGVVAYWAGELGKDPAIVDFDLGPNMAASVLTLNYGHDARYAAKCLRAMALIAAGEDGRLKGHIERDGAGPGNEYVRNAKGDLVVRTYLATHTPNAHRLFWVKAERPEFLNVSGHEGHPAL